MNAQKSKNSTLINQPLNCPWSSRAPITNYTSKKDNHFLSEPINNDYFFKMTSNTNHHQLNANGFCPMRTQSCLSNQDSTTQFFHFFRLMQLFPEIHPATLHTVLYMCKNDFFCTVDKLLYIKKVRQGAGNKPKLVKMYQNGKVKGEHPYWNCAAAQNCDKTLGKPNSNQTDLNVKKVVQKLIFIPQERSYAKNEETKSIRNTTTDIKLQTQCTSGNAAPISEFDNNTYLKSLPV